MADIWAELFKAVETNKAVAVSLTPGAQIKRPKRRVGRPCTRGPARFGHYAGYVPEEGGRPRCAFVGCGKHLRRDQKVACCAEHEKLAVEAARRLIARAA